MEQLVDLIGRYGLLFVFANVLAEQAGLPIPALPTLLLAGAFAADGTLSGPWILAIAVAASTIADYAWYLTGRRLGHRVLRAVCRVSVSPDSCVRQTEGIFERYGLLSLVIAKFIPGYTTVAPPLAGILGTPPLLFLAYNAAGAVVWAGSAIAAGLIFHRVVDRIVGALEALGGWGIVLLPLGLVSYMVFRWVRLLASQRTLGLARISAPDLKLLLERIGICFPTTSDGTPMQGTVNVLRGHFAGGLGEGQAEGSDQASARRGEALPGRPAGQGFAA